MSELSFLRHSGWVAPQDFSQTIHIIGCGAVGSNLALMLAKMGAHRLVLWDADLVEGHNLPNQAYMPKHIGMPKVEALKDVLMEFNCEMLIESHNKFFEAADAASLKGTVVIATDSMKSRKTIYDALDGSFTVDYFYEIRLGFDYGELHAVDVNDMSQMENWACGLKDDSEIPDGPCNIKICTTLVNLISSYAVHMISAQYAAKANAKEFKPEYRTMFDMSPFLRIHSIKE